MSKIQTTATTTATTTMKSGSTSKTESNSTSNPSLKVLDVGCGIGGPMRNICKFTGVDVTGLTLNQYQVNRGNELCQMDPQLGLNGRPRCRSVQGDFMEMPFEDNSYDAAYAIEATCHAPDRVGVYSEIYRVLKPGSIFACYEWCMTDNFDPKNEDHLRMKKEIEEGDGLPDICHTSVCSEAMKKAGFEIIDEKDIAEEDYGAGYGGKPWMLPLLPSWNPMTQRFQFNWLGKALTKYALKGLEFIRLAPKGTSQTQIMLQKGGSGLGDAGNAKIFTPMYLMVGRVPMDKKKI
jgi:sterol 24-C-methyltransferase